MRDRITLPWWVWYLVPVWLGTLVMHRTGWLLTTWYTGRKPWRRWVFLQKIQGFTEKDEPVLTYGYDVDLNGGVK